MSRSALRLCQLQNILLNYRNNFQMTVNRKPCLFRITLFHGGRPNLEKEKENAKEEGLGSYETRLISADDFDNIQSKNKEAFIEMIEIFNDRDHLRSGHIEFIYTALKHMKEYGVHRDLQTYKKLIEVMPKGRFVPRNLIQSEYMHFPKQQQCIVDLLEQMEEYGVIPDWEMEEILVNTFGKRGFPVRRYWRMMYWMPKFKNLSPWPLPNPVPSDVFELAKLAISRITSVDVRSEISIFKTSDVKASVDDTWIVSGQSPVQRQLLESHPIDKPIYVEGGFRIYLREVPLLYFILRAEPDKSKRKIVRDDNKADNVSEIKIPFLTTPESSKDDELMHVRSVHEQDDGIIYGVCATGTSSKDSLLSWVRCLEKNGNPKLEKIPVLFTFKSPIGETVSLGDEGDDSPPDDKTKQLGEQKLLSDE